MSSWRYTVSWKFRLVGFESIQ